MKLNYYRINSPRHLADIIQYFWVLEGTGINTVPFLHRALADCSPELIFYYKGRFNIETKPAESVKTFNSGIFGQTSIHRKFATSADFGIFGVYFYPFATRQLFNLPASELSNEMVDISALFGFEGVLLEEKIMSAEDNNERVKIFTEFITRKTHLIKNKEPLLRQKLKQIIDGREVLSISTVRRDFHLSRRQFERKFKEYAGFGPKAFLNIVRFNALIKSGNKNQTSLTQMAYDFGYYDQSHFIRDFQKFSGYAPSRYFKQQSEGVDHRASTDAG
jgi:AraC-like DNA-binding protein